MLKSIINTIIFSLFFSGISISQVNPANNGAFLQNEVATVKIFLDTADLAFILAEENEYSNLEFPATFIYQSTFINDTVSNVGFRLRGNTSRSSAKKSFKVSFNAFTQGLKYKGLEKMNLNGEHNDVSIMRAKISHEILTNSDLIAARTSYVKLFINEEYKGLYLNVEHIDEEFIQKRFPANDSGNLYKCNWGADFTYWGPNQSNYQFVYELKTNETTNDYSALINLINTVDNSSNTNFPCQIEELFDVYSYLKNAAFEILIGQWDGYIFNKNNFYLYQRPSDGKFVYISYDLDNTFGVDWFDIDWSTRNIYTWSGNENRPLFNRLMEVPYYKRIFSDYMEQILQENFNSTNLLARLNEIQILITDAGLSDTYKGLDYGFTNDDFLNSINQTWGYHISQSLSEYISNRELTASNQLVFQSATWPCLTSLEENSLNNEHKTLIKTYNFLGQEIDANSTNTLKFLIYSDGSSEKIIDFE